MVVDLFQGRLADARAHLEPMRARLNAGTVVGVAPRRNLERFGAMLALFEGRWERPARIVLNRLGSQIPERFVVQLVLRKAN